MTLSFWKVMFSAQEVLDLLAEVDRDAAEFEERFVALAEERSRKP
jgi:hypothetical protein